MCPDTVRTVTSWPLAAYLAIVPPTPRISSSGWGAMMRTDSSILVLSVGTAGRLRPGLDDLRHRHRQDEAPAAGRVARVLHHDRVGEVPGQDQKVGRAALVDPLGRTDRDMGAGCEEALLEWVVVHDEVDQV